MKAATTQAKKLWFPYRGLGSRLFHRGVVFPPPRLAQLARLLFCRVVGHDFGSWRVETEDWFERVSEPEAGAWRACLRECGTMERIGW